MIHDPILTTVVEVFCASGMILVSYQVGGGIGHELNMKRQG